MEGVKQKYPEPHQEVSIGYAPSLGDWQTLYIRYTSFCKEPEKEKKDRGRKKG